MKLAHHLICAGAFTAASFAGAVHAQAMPMPMPAAKPMAAESADGEVRKVDRKARTITLKHGEIRNLGMAPMAMQFVLREGVAVDKLKVGDKVRFKAVHEGGKYVVTEIKPAR